VNYSCDSSGVRQENVDDSVESSELLTLIVKKSAVCIFFGILDQTFNNITITIILAVYRWHQLYLFLK